ncbi:uncharacterized protein LOC117902142 [Drosophila subobscura]|nr:uncharacterized protein LOC117902142 [Drosophila subobscura]
MKGIFLAVLLLQVLAAWALNCQPCKLLEARKTHANETQTQLRG